MKIQTFHCLNQFTLCPQHKELRKTQAEVFVAMCKDHFQAEMDVMLKHHDSVYDVLKLIDPRPAPGHHR